MFKKYKLTVLLKIDNSIIDSTVLEYKNELTRSEIIKKVKQYLTQIGYGGPRFKFSLIKQK